MKYHALLSLFLLLAEVSFVDARPLDVANPQTRLGSQFPRQSVSLLSGESYRRAFCAARQALGKQPGLVCLSPHLPTVIIPDLHGRRQYLDAVLNTHDVKSGKTYYDLLRQHQVQILCLGDAMHSETRNMAWRRGMPQETMNLEMAESLGTLRRLAELKAQFPKHFHFLRGNHEDIGPLKGSIDGCPLKIRKTHQFIKEKFGQPLLQEMSDLFSCLPLAAKGKGFIACHAPPALPISKKDVESRSARASYSLTRLRTRLFHQFRRESPKYNPQAVLNQTIAALGDDPHHDLLIHGHLHAQPLVIEGRRIYFGNPREQTFLYIDPHLPCVISNQLFEAPSGRRVQTSFKKKD